MSYRMLVRPSHAQQRTFLREIQRIKSIYAALRRPYARWRTSAWE